MAVVVAVGSKNAGVVAEFAFFQLDATGFTTASLNPFLRSFLNVEMHMQMTIQDQSQTDISHRKTATVDFFKTFQCGLQS